MGGRVGDPGFSPRDLRDGYDRSAGRYDERFAALQRPKHEAVLARVRGCARVLDLGCGTGLLAREGRGCWTGLDLSLEMLRLASGRLSRRVQGTAVALPFRDASFDAAVAVTSLLVTPRDMARALLELRRVLVPGGLLVVTLLAGEVPGGYEADLRASGFLLEEAPFDCGQDTGFTARRG